MSIADEYERGYRDGLEGGPKHLEGDKTFVNSFIDGFLGGALSQREQESIEAYERGYEKGRQDRSKEKAAAV